MDEIKHADIKGNLIHLPFKYQRDTDPALIPGNTVTAGDWWLDTTIVAMPLPAPFLTNLKAFWEFEEANGATRADAFGTSNLIDNGTVAQASGKVGFGAQFNGSSNYFTCADNAALSSGDVNFTITAWVYLNGKAADMGIIEKTSATQGEYYLAYRSSNDRFEFAWYNPDASALTAVLANSLGSPSTATWYFIVVSHNPMTDEISIRVNHGTPDVVSTGGSSPSDTAAPIGVGAVRGVQWFLNGRIDQMGIWRQIFSDNEQATLYNNGSGVSFANISTPPEILGLQLKFRNDADTAWVTI